MATLNDLCSSGGQFDEQAIRLMKSHSDQIKPMPKPKELNVPVFQTLLIKKLTENHDGDVFLVGTLIQRSLLIDLNLMKPNGREPQPYFDTRVNDEAVKDDEMTVRKTVAQRIDAEEMASGAAAVSRSTTFAVKFPMQKHVIMSAHPFHICAMELLVELTSFIGANDAAAEGGASDAETLFELRPDLLCNLRDVEELVKVRDPDAVDEMASYDIFNVHPTIENQLEIKRSKAGSTHCYVPKTKLTFYMYKPALRPFVETLMPVIFASLGNTLNCLYVDEFGDFLANALAIGLTIAFMIPQFSSNEEYIDAGIRDPNQFYVLILFLALMLSCTPSTEKLSCVVMWGSLYIPWRNLRRYLIVSDAIRARADGKGSQGDMLSDPEGYTHELLARRLRRWSSDAKAAVAERHAGGGDHKEKKKEKKKGADINFQELAPFYAVHECKEVAEKGASTIKPEVVINERVGRLGWSMGENVDHKKIVYRGLPRNDAVLEQ